MVVYSLVYKCYMKIKRGIKWMEGIKKILKRDIGF